jgi:hypothetical protein
MIAKSATIKDRGGKSGERAVKAVDLTSGDLRCVPDSRLRPSQGGLTAAQKSADGKVGGAICRRPERMEAGSRNVHFDGAMRQTSGIVRPARHD